MIEFVWPQTTGEWWAWPSAVFLVFCGLWIFAAPQKWLSLMNLQPRDARHDATVFVRGAMGGSNIGLGLAVLVLHPQPLLYLALGAMYFFAALAGTISIILTNAHSKPNWSMLTIAGVMSFGPLSYALGYIA